jgi:hypothetical protein
MTKDEEIKTLRHVCTSCCHPLSCSPDNPRRTDWCVICGHRSEGQKRMTTESKWGSVVVVSNENTSADLTAPVPAARVSF